NKREIAETIDMAAPDALGPIVKTITTAARETGRLVVAGGMPEASGAPARPYTTSLLVAPDGRIAARYRKIHLFDVDLPDGTRLLESGATSAGTQPLARRMH